MADGEHHDRHPENLVHVIRPSTIKKFIHEHQWGPFSPRTWGLVTHQGTVDQVECAIMAGANVNSAVTWPNNRASALFTFVSFGSDWYDEAAEKAALLIQHKANVAIADADGFRAGDLCSLRNHDLDRLLSSAER